MSWRQAQVSSGPRDSQQSDQTREARSIWVHQFPYLPHTIAASHQKAQLGPTTEHRTRRNPKRPKTSRSGRARNDRTGGPCRFRSLYLVLPVAHRSRWAGHRCPPRLSLLLAIGWLPLDHGPAFTVSASKARRPVHLSSAAKSSRPIRGGGVACPYCWVGRRFIEIWSGGSVTDLVRES